METAVHSSEQWNHEYHAWQMLQADVILEINLGTGCGN